MYKKWYMYLVYGMSAVILYNILVSNEAEAGTYFRDSDKKKPLTQGG